MTLTDTGPLVALIDADEKHSARCRATLAELDTPLVTSWAVLTEAMHLLGKRGGWEPQALLWQMVERELLVLAELNDAMATRCIALMRRYDDHPMDLADATLVALAEERDLREVFTLDAHFRSYRLKNRRHLRVVPS